MIQSDLCLGCMETKSLLTTCPYCDYLEGTLRESALHLNPGTTLQDKYLLGRVLGQGGFGITYLAWDMKLNIKLAIKEYLPQQLAYRTGSDYAVSIYKSSLIDEFTYGLKRFLEEARTLARFNEHPNIVTIHDYFETNNTAYLVMNYHEGITLQSYLDSKGGQIPVEQALKIFMPVLDALKEIHSAGILHRDISPDNLLIDRSGRVVLIDFGAARQAISENSHSLSVIMKPGYSPEEQYRRKGEQGPWSDIYALAASFYRSITGLMPPESLDRLADDTLAIPSALGIIIDINLEQSILKALAVRSENRYQTANDFLEIFLASNSNTQQSNQEVEEVIFNEETSIVGINADETANSEENKMVEKMEGTSCEKETEAIKMIDEKAFPDQDNSDPESMPEKLVAAESINVINSNLYTASYFSYIKNHKRLLAICSLAGLIIYFAVMQYLLANSDQQYQVASNEQQDYSILTKEEQIEPEEEIIVVLKPSTPVLTEPEDGFIVPESEMTIQWLPVEGAEKYKVLLTHTSNGEIIEKVLNGITQYIIDGLLGDGSTYDVQLAAGNGAGWSEYTKPVRIVSGTAPQNQKPSESIKNTEEKQPVPAATKVNTEGFKSLERKKLLEFHMSEEYFRLKDEGKLCKNGQPGCSCGFWWAVGQAAE